jgi:uncharacterized protein (TIGR03067 family)
MSVRLLLGLLVVAVTAETARPAPAPFPRKRDAQNELSLIALQGYWKVERCERTSNDGTYRVVKDPVTHIHVNKDIWIFMQGKGTRSNEYTIIVDPAHRPARFTFRNKTQTTGGTDGLMTQLAGGRIKILYQWNRPRPGSFHKPPAEYWALTLIRETTP